MTAYFERELAPTVLAALGSMPVVVVTGLRQTGKTTFLQNQFPGDARRFVTFDDFAQLSAAKSDPDQFVNTDEALTIDEAHKCPEIFTAIKRAVDKRRAPGRFLLSGSANFTLLKGITETLAGRAVYFEMRPFNRREISGRTAEPSFLERFSEDPSLPRYEGYEPFQSDEILKGGMPSVCLGHVKERSFWLKGYEQTYLERDIREISRIENIIAYRNLLHLACLRTGQILNLSQLGRDAKLTSATASRYLSLLETSFILSKLDPYLKNRASRLIKSPKIYVSDSGLACYMAGIDDLPAGLQRAHDGRHVRDLCGSELAFHCWEPMEGSADLFLERSGPIRGGLHYRSRSHLYGFGGEVFRQMGEKGSCWLGSVSCCNTALQGSRALL
jgi:uncharacterized protein